MTSVAVQCDLQPGDVQEMAARLLQLEQENAKLRETLAQQSTKMRTLKREGKHSSGPAHDFTDSSDETWDV